MGHARVQFEGPDLHLSCLADRLAQIRSAAHYGFSRLVCYVCGKAAATDLTNVSSNKEMRGGKQAKRCTRVRSQVIGVALLIASQAVLAQEPLYDIDIPSMNAAEALNELAEQTGAVMLFPYDLVVSRQTRAVVGRYTLAGALEAILEGSGLSSGLTDRQVVQITAEGSREDGQREASVETLISQGEDEMPSENRAGFWRRLTATLGLAAAAATTAIPGQAQTQLPGVNSLEEIVVTARRREESLVDVPVSITVMNADFMQQQNILDTIDLFSVTPGVDYDEVGGRAGSVLTIRGVSPGGQGTLNQKATIFVDGVPIVGNNGGTFQYIDLERVEVLRGPQSAAFGRATFAGAVNYVTRDPGDEFNARVRLTASDLNRTVVGANFDGPITDSLGFTVDFYEEDFEGPDDWISTDGFDIGATNTQHLAAKLKFTPNDVFSMELSASISETDDGPASEYMLPVGTAAACNNTTLGNGRPYVQGEWDCAQQTGPNPMFHDLTQDGFVPGTPFFNQALSFSILEPTDTRERQRIAAEFEFNLDNGGVVQTILSSASDETLKWSTVGGVAGQTSSFMGMFNPMLTTNMANVGGSDTEDYLDVRWLSPDDESLRWMVGVSRYEFEYSAQVFTQYAGIARPDLDLQNLVNGGMPFQPTRRSDQTTEATGVYGSINWDINDRTTLSLEGRFQQDENVTVDVISGLTVVQETDSFQPRLAINHALNDGWSIYGQVSQGTNPAIANPQMLNPLIQRATEAAFAAGVINFTADQFATADEEELTNYEFGIKGSALDGRLNLAAAIYVIDWQDIVQGESFFFAGAWNDGSFSGGEIFPLAALAPRGVAVNSGSGDLTGVELEATWRATDRWFFRATLALQESEYDQSCDFTAAGGQPRRLNYGFAPNCVTVGGLPGVQVGGNQIELNAEVQASASVFYTAPLGGNWRWGANLGLRHTGSTFNDVVNITELPDVTTATGQVNFNNDNWEIIVYGANLTDEDAVRGLREFPEVTLTGDQNSWLYSRRLPRELGLRLNYSF